MCPRLRMAPRESYSDVDTVISEDESGVRGGELGGRHCDGCDRDTVGSRDVESFGAGELN
jgi:hypothetical protein